MRPEAPQRTIPALLGMTLLLAAAAAAQGERPEVGETAPDFTLQSSQGESYTLSEEQGEKLLVVFFRGTW